jgi:hypothetical protein
MPQLEERRPQEAASQPLFTTGTLRWSAAVRVAFRLIFAYEILYSFPFPFNLVPGLEKLFGWYSSLFAVLTTWTGAHILHLSQPVVWSPLLGSDSMFRWV